MSTRATYSFELLHSPKKYIHYYIHGDGYFKGAANFFNRMHKLYQLNLGQDGRMSKNYHDNPIVDINSWYAELFMIANSPYINIVHDIAIPWIEYDYYLKVDGSLKVIDLKEDEEYLFSHYTDFIKKYMNS